MQVLCPQTAPRSKEYGTPADIAGMQLYIIDVFAGYALDGDGGDAGERRVGVLRVWKCDAHEVPQRLRR